MQLGELRKYPSEQEVQVYPDEKEQATHPGGQGQHPFETKQQCALHVVQTLEDEHTQHPIGQLIHDPLCNNVAELHARHVRSSLHQSQLGGQELHSPVIDDKTYPVSHELHRFSSQHYRHPFGQIRQVLRQVLGYYYVRQVRVEVEKQRRNDKNSKVN